MKTKLLLIISVLVLFSCSKDEYEPTPNPETVGLYVLCEGYFNTNTSDIDYYDLLEDVLKPKYYSLQNGKTLGDTGNDMAIYGNKLYTVVSGSSSWDGTVVIEGYIDVIDIGTGKSQKRIKITDADDNVSTPRCIAFHNNKAYITTYSKSVVRLDTASLTIDNIAELDGTFAEGICYYNNKLYVCNSGQGLGNTISVIDVNTFKQTDTITVPANPLMIKATTSGDIYFSTADLSWSTGDPSNLYMLDVAQKKATTKFNCRASKIAVGKDYIYAVDYDWNNSESNISKIDRRTKAVANISSKFSNYGNIYGVSVNPLNDDVYLTSQDQDVLVLDKNDNYVLSFKTGANNPSVVVPVIK